MLEPLPLPLTACGVHSSPAIAFDLNGEFLYVAGGSNGAQKHKVRPLTLSHTWSVGLTGVVLQSAERLRVAVNKWEALDDMSTIRSGCCAAMGGDSRFYVMGGYDGKTRLNTCEYYDPATGAWAAGPTMVKRRCVASTVTDAPCVGGLTKLLRAQEWGGRLCRPRRLRLCGGRHRRRHAALFHRTGAPVTLRRQPNDDSLTCAM